MGVGGGLHSTDDFQSVMETSLSQDTSLVKFSWRYDQQLIIVWSGAPLLVLGRGLCSMNDFQIIMKTTLSQGISLVKFS